ncbi:MAG: hypothetical protein NVSMB22_08000 [Chloroflexota bacterium]
MKQSPSLYIRRGMDVYTAGQKRYLGQVTNVWQGGTFSTSADERGAGARQTGSATESATQNPEVRQEDGSAQSPTRKIGNRIQGESEGPFPTIAAGNTGPINQSAEHEYATAPHGAHGGVVYFAVRPGRYNPFARRFYIPTTAVHSMSMERIVVDADDGDRLKEWQRKPDMSWATIGQGP